MIKKTAFIIGASSDIGKETALLFAKKGYNLFLTYNENKINYLNEIKESTIDIQIYKMDITKENSIKQSFEYAFNYFDYIDTIIICPGVCAKEMMLLDMPNEIIDKILNINLRGIIYCNKYAAQYLIKNRHGSIVNISSIYGINGGSCEAVYSATKAGIIGLTKALAKEYAPYLRVNAVAPGFIETKMTNNFNNEEKNEINSNIPLKRLGVPTDIANAIYFLSSEEASYITGEVLKISGGADQFN